jgi:hypothetical protein
MVPIAHLQRRESLQDSGRGPCNMKTLSSSLKYKAWALTE